MTSLRRFSLCASAVTSLAIVACADRSATPGDVALQPAQRLVGAWDVRFELERPLMLAVASNATVRSVRGQFAFVENRWLSASYPWMQRPTDYGTYDVDFTPFGFESRTNGETPTAVARWLHGDSVQILLGLDESPVAVTMRGRLTSDSILGTWDVAISRVAGGGGRFLMSRHRDRAAVARIGQAQVSDVSRE
jgi:hypothetical protein